MHCARTCDASDKTSTAGQCHSVLLERADGTYNVGSRLGIFTPVSQMDRIESLWSTLMRLRVTVEVPASAWAVTNKIKKVRGGREAAHMPSQTPV
jgi:hypothetical protein